MRTIRAPLDEDLYGEAGAIRVPDMHRRVREIVGRLGLSLIPFESGNGAALLRVSGRTVRLPDGMGAFGAGALVAARTNRASVLVPCCSNTSATCRRASTIPPLAPERYAEWKAIDQQTWPAWLGSRGASAGAIAIMTAGGDSRELSALYVLRQFALLRNVTQYFKIDGGMDQLPRRLAAAVGPVVRYQRGGGRRRSTA